MSQNFGSPCRKNHKLLTVFKNSFPEKNLFPISHYSQKNFIHKIFLTSMSIYSSFSIFGALSTIKFNSFSNVEAKASAPEKNWPG